MTDRLHFILRVEGMTCDGCARHVAQALKAVPGVESAEVGDWREGTAAVVAAGTVTEEALAEAVAKAGYRAVVQAQRPLESGKQAPRSEGADFDLMTLGGGSAAFAAAIKAAELGTRVAIVEEGTIGGTCVNIGCVPSKTLIKAAEICYHAAYSHFEGMTACPPPSDWRRVVEQKDELVAQLREEKYIKLLDSYPTITLLRGHARLTGGRSVFIDGQAYTPGKILIATGSRPWAPPIPGLAEAGYLDSTDALSLPALPQTLIVIGGGAIGLELGQLFARFGVRVTLVETFPHIAAAEEPEISDALAGYLTAERVRVLTGTKIERVDRTEAVYRMAVDLNGAKQTLEAEQLLVATGRRAHTEGFGLEEAGIALGTKGEILVDRHLQTKNPDVYAAGDCIGDPMFVYVAAYAGQLAAENALTGAGRVYDLSALPRVTFTDPQLASVGLTEAQAKAEGLEVETALLPVSQVPRAQASRNPNGLIKLVRERSTLRLLGAHVLAAEAGEVIQEATLAIRFKLTTKDVIGTLHPYLTMAEGIKLAALTFSKDVTQLSCCAT
ncbi:mercury(II) reductase [Methylocaldum sp. BRCS4]|jgi:mercuric reductase|uniref:mercury(II) reductase n=1 Tax=Methylocaldum sp. 14B TaxID=1912213 RepID=UPI00098B7D29|nr:mercury(II) reductase [Methylocaldum sp. 14B]MVF23093.1 mercury(II) reductase [Methylocaldum sp. BRCS4]